jgi:outer membrane biogenesis lipoprotein LolB
MMSVHASRSIRAALAAALALLVLAGCAGRPSNGVEIVVWQEQERQRLQAQGFPQYNFD